MYQDFTFREFDVLTQQDLYLTSPALTQTQFAAPAEYNQMDGGFLLDIPIYHIDDVESDATGCCACSACGSEAIKMAIIPGTDYVIDIAAFDGAEAYQILSTFFAEMQGNGSAQSGGTIAMEGDTPGDATTTAVLTVGTDYVDELEVAGDHDWIAFTPTDSGVYIFTLDGTGSAALEDPLLQLRDSAGNLLREDDDGGAGRNSRLAAQLNAGETYYLDVQAWEPSSGPIYTGEYTLAVTERPPLPEYSIEQIAEYLREGSWTQRTHDDADQDASNGTNINYYIGDLPAGAQALAVLALEFWAEMANLNFIAVTSAAVADIDFIDNEDGAFARSTVSGGTTITNVEINVASDWNGGNLAVNSYTLQTYIHEVGHALGLGHGGPYNGNADYGLDNIYTNDTWGTTVMSYFDQGEANFGTPRLVLGPQAADILAIQQLYGVNMDTRTGDSVYGFNTTETGTIYDAQDWQNQGIRLPSFSIWDAGGTDTLDFSGYISNQRISLLAGTWSDVGDNTNTGNDVTDPLYNLVSIAIGAVIENAIGGTGSDTITGNDVSNVLTGNGGNDILDGGDGIDYASFSGAQSAYTIVDNGDGTFTVTHNNGGSDGSDTLTNIEFARFSDGDVELAAADDGSINLTPDADNYSGTAEADIINGLDGNDTIFGLGGNDVINGGAGNDRLYGGDGDDELNGGDGNDDFFGGAGSNIFDGGAGRDRVFYTDAAAGLTANFIDQSQNTGEAAGDTYISIESINGSNFDDVITSGNDNNDLVGLGGDDVLIGARGNDRLFGGTGNDRLLGGNGNDDLFGQDGDDTYVMQANAGNDRIFEFTQGEDIIEYVRGPGAFSQLTITQSGGNTIITSLHGTITLMGFTGSLIPSDFKFTQPTQPVDNTIYLTNADDTYIGDEDANTIDGLDGTDTIYGQGGDDILIGGNGNDRLFGGEGADVLNGGDGVDRVYYTQATTGIAANLIDQSQNTGEAAGDTYISIEQIYGSNFDDRITAGNTDDQIVGLGGNDILIGARGNDRLFGGDGNDRLLGGNGNDDLYGQGGNDTFVIRANAGNDRIFDFTQGSDLIEMNGGPAGFGDLTITQNGSNTVITSSQGVTTLISFTGSLTANDFTFVNASASEPLSTDKDNLVAEPLIINELDNEIQADAVEAFLSANASQNDVLIVQPLDNVADILTPDDADYWDAIA